MILLRKVIIRKLSYCFRRVINPLINTPCFRHNITKSDLPLTWNLNSSKLKANKLFDEVINISRSIKYTDPPSPYWIESTPETSYPSLTEDINADVAIVGGGIVGITCAYLLAREGLSVVIIEADRILQGTTGHTTAKITSQHALIYDKLKTQMGEEKARQYAESRFQPGDKSLCGS